jgi:hypothetical protein
VSFLVNFVKREEERDSHGRDSGEKFRGRYKGLRLCGIVYISLARWWGGMCARNGSMEFWMHEYAQILIAICSLGF